MTQSDRRGTVLRLVVSLAVLGGAYVGLCAWVSGHVPASATVGGVRIGGLPRDDAAAAVEKQATVVLATPIVLTVPGSGKTLAVEPGKAGLSVDTAASLDGLTGFTLDPRTVWDKLTGSVDLPLLTHADDGVLSAYLERLAPSVQAPGVEGSIGFDGGDVTVALPKPGRALDIAGTKLALRKAFPDATTATAVVTDLEPKVSAEQVESVADGFARQAVSAPITLLADGKATLLQPAQFAPAISFAPDGGTLKPTFDEARLSDLVARTVKVKMTPAKDARWTFEPGNGRPKLVPSVDGTAVDQQALTQQVIAAMTSQSRTVTITPSVVKPRFTTADADAAGVKEVVVDFSSPFPPEDTTRTHNLVLATQIINGTYVPPGGTFSLNGILGERTTDKGYADGTVIINGRLTRGTGGGISQVSTTIYNLAYFAGVDILEATPHAFFIPRYPEGREATVYWPTVDNKWKNDTPHGMLLQTWVEGGHVRGRVWSTKTWDVKSVKGPRRNVVPPKTVHDNSLTCYPQQPNPGFDVIVTRQWYRPGSATLVKSEDVHTHYVPENRIICTNPDARP